MPAEMDDDKERFPLGVVKTAFTKVIDTEIRRGILEDGERPDARKTNEVRPISGQTNVLPRTHGSAIFTRGTTQALSITTLAPISYAQLIDTMDMWKFGDYKSYTSLNLLAAVFGIESPKDDIDGSQVWSTYWIYKDLERIKNYCMKDVVTDAQLLLKFKGMELLKPENISFTN